MSELDWAAPFERLQHGMRFRTRGRTITEADLVAFSTLTGDMHPQHLDAEWASRSRFGERIAHGMLLVSYGVGLVPFDPLRVIALRRIGDVVFKRPARIGATIHLTGRIESLRALSEQAGLVGWRWEIREGTGVLCRARLEVLWASDGPADPSADLPEGVIPC